MPTRASIRYPNLTRTEWGTCRRCGCESGYCALIQLLIAGIWSRPFLACATCRESNRGFWIVAHGWQNDHAETYESMGSGFRKWAAENPPLDEEIERINREEEAYGNNKNLS